MSEFDDLIKRYDETAEYVDEIVNRPYHYIQNIPGKNIRTKLLLALNHWYKVEPDKLEQINQIVQIIHTGTIMHDDIEDDSHLRRGYPTAHVLFGTPIAINTAIYTMWKGMDIVLKLNNYELAKEYNELIKDMHRGQGMELYWRDFYICPTEEEYKLMVMRKTGALFLICSRFLGLYSKHKLEFNRLITILGIYFQIRDDYCSLCHLDYANKKTYCEDLTEGKFSFPLIHALKYDKDDQIAYIIRKRTSQYEMKRLCMELMEKYGSFTYTRSVLEELETAAFDEIKRLNGNPYFEAILNSLNDWKSIKHPVV